MIPTPGRIVKFCAQECERQKSGEMSVYDMFLAYNSAMELRTSFLLFEEDVIILGSIVEPKKNHNGYRNVPVTFGTTGITLSNHKNIPHQMSNLIKHQSALTPDEFYQEFEIIHPFVDGNGRVGAILYNLLNSTMSDPVHPPEYVVHPKG